MRLKSIKLAGFKSFVDPTTVPFSTNMTAIVGPNGCGKSNIIDAVRWVMGESSAKNLRGESMTDVIFNGSSGRQPIGQASIELIFDNSSGKLSGEYSAFSEISIKRKVTREGVSQYYLNGSKCRRRDVTDIFLGTGMGPRSYAIIEQGMIARLIESKPEELRVYLEEAAGISKYKERRRETENRMRRTQENLERLSDIREELGKQLAHLKRQANAAEKYAEYKKEERLLSAKLHFIYWNLLATDLTDKSSLVSQYEQEIETAVLGKNANENKIDALKTTVEERQEEFNKFQAKFYQSGAEIATLEQKIKYEKTRQAEQSQQLARLMEELDELENVLLMDQESLDAASLDLETIEEEVLALEENAELAAAKLEEEERSLHEWQERWDQFNRSNSDAQKNAELEQAKIQEYENRIKDLELRHDRLSHEKLELSESIESLDLGQWEEESLLLDEKILELQLQIDALIPDIESTQTELEVLGDKKAQINDELSSNKAVLASLETLQNASLENESETMKAWMTENGFDSQQRLVDQLQVDPDWEIAVQHVLKDWLDAYVTDNSLSSFVADLDTADFSFAALHHDPDSSAVSTKPLAEASKSLASKVDNAGSLLPLLSKILLANDIDSAISLIDSLGSNESVITQSGLWISKHWIKQFKADDASSGVIARTRQIKELTNLIPDLEQQQSSCVESIAALKDKLSEQKSHLHEKELSLKSSTQDKARLAAVHATDQAKLDQFQLRLKRNDDELFELISNIDLTRENLEQARHRWQDSLSQLEELTEQKSDFLDKREALTYTLEQVRREARDKQAAAHQKQLEKAQKQNQFNSIESTIIRLKKEKELKRERQLELQNADGGNSGELEDLSLSLEGLLETRMEFEQKLNNAKLELETASNDLRVEEADRAKYEARIQSAREKLESIRMDTQALAINKKNLEERIAEDGFETEALKQQITEDDTEENLKTSLEQLAQRITRLGSINLAAIDEYKVQSERKTHLDEQNDELEDALNTLVEAIKKIDKETRARFKETYDKVNEGLQRLFPKIFGGGSAYLELTDDNLLETGVMIIARPPGKKNATIHLLSGGEKSLTAIALIFAIFELNPAPFCMLDEVDAPLDDANVGRFANMVKEMSSQVQFIYISHNKVSMEKADHLMGVTMHEPGVSRLVSVDVDEAAALVEA